jgi:hypothetical protein
MPVILSTWHRIHSPQIDPDSSCDAQAHVTVCFPLSRVCILQLAAFVVPATNHRHQPPPPTTATNHRRPGRLHAGARRLHSSGCRWHHAAGGVRSNTRRSVVSSARFALAASLQAAGVNKIAVVMFEEKNTDFGTCF